MYNKSSTYLRKNSEHPNYALYSQIVLQIRKFTLHANKTPPRQRMVRTDVYREHRKWESSSKDPLDIPVGILRTLEHLPPLLRKLGFPALVGDLLEKDGLPNLSALLSLTGLLPLRFFKLLF